MDFMSELASYVSKTLVKLCTENVKPHAMKAYCRVMVQLHIYSQPKHQTKVSNQLHAPANTHRK